jgi:hypothetical protein
MRLFVLGFLVACSQPTSECLDVFYEDADGDGHGDPDIAVTACVAPSGFGTTDDDCDDNDLQIHPGAPERCNGIDDDCDGDIDPFATWYVDHDGDGWGIGTRSCDTPPASTAIVGGDCNDADDQTHPGADEICNGRDDDCDETEDEDAVNAPVWYLDVDGDDDGDAASEYTACEPLNVGDVTVGTDCDDTDNDVNPNAQETCDGIDNDCNGMVDDVDVAIMPVWYIDADGDEYGDPGISVISCASSDGWVSIAGDCDDTSAAVNLGATEVCNKIDDDCDGGIDDDDHDDSPEGRHTFYVDDDHDGLGVSGPYDVDYCFAPWGYTDTPGDCDDDNIDVHEWITLYRDQDHDGYGEYSARLCQKPDEDWVLMDRDCDDTMRIVFPGATELCDGVDDDCDGLADDADSSTKWPTFYDDLDGDGYGDDRSANVPGQCELPSDSVVRGGDCDDDVWTTNVAADEICVNSMDDDCDHVIDPCSIELTDADWSLIGPPAKSASTRGFTVLATDLNADGVTDIVANAPDLKPPVSVFLGPRSGLSHLSGADITFLSSKAFTLAGGMDAADVDDDGWTDMLIGAPDDHAAYLFLGPFRDGAHWTPDMEFLVPDHGPSATVAKLLPDFDGDGSPDVVVNAIDLEDGALEGTVYVAPATTTARRPLSLPKNATYTYEGAPADELGASAVPIGDVTGDGIDDLAVGAPGSAVFVLAGGEAGGAYMLDIAVGSLFSPRADGFGYSIAATDDDDDGAVDLFVGAPEDDGAVYGFHPPFTTTMRNTGDAYVHWRGADGLGYSVAAGGDVDGDGAQDVLLGAYDSHHGHAYLSLRGAEGVVEVEDLLTFDPPMEGNATGYDVEFLPDWSGDERTDVVFGEPFFSSGEVDPSGHARVDVVYSEHLH